MDPKNKQPVGLSETPNQGTEESETGAWLRTIDNTVRWRDSIGARGGWKRFIDEYKNNWDFLQSMVNIPLVPLNLIFAYVKTEIARLYFKDPWITVNAKRVEDIGAAQIAEQIINYTWNELKLKEQMKLALLETLLVGHAWIKVGYVAEFGTVESQPKDDVPKRGRPAAKKVAEVDTNEYLKSENVFAYYVPYTDVIFDPSATFPATHNARWMAHRIVKPLRAVQESGIYEHTEELTPSTAMGEQNQTYMMPDMLKEAKEAGGMDVRSVVLWEIYDLDHQTITTVSPGCKKKLREIPLPEYLNGGFPFVQFAFNPVPGDVYPMSDIAPHEGQIIEMIKLVSIEINHLKRWNRQMIVDADTFTEQEMAKFKDANDGGIIVAQTGGAKEKIFIPPYAPVQSDIYGVFNQVFQMWQMISGQTSTDQGGQAKTQTRTLGELRMSLQGSKARPEEKVDVLEDAIAEVARKLLAIMQKKYDLPKIARIVGPNSVKKKMAESLPQRPSAQPQQPGAPGMPSQPNPVAPQAFSSDFGFSWNRTDIMGDMDVDVLAGSTVPLDRASQLEILEKMQPVMQAAGVTPGSPAAKAFAREMARLAGLMSMESIMDIADQQPPQPDPRVQESQAKIQSQQAQTQIKVQAQQAQEEIKLKSMQEKLKVDMQKYQLEVEKMKMDAQNNLVQSIIGQFRPQNGNGNGGNHEQG